MKKGVASVSKFWVSHAEAMTQNVLGLLIAFIVLTCFGLEPMQSVQIQAILFFLSYARSYCVRYYFRRFD